MFVEDNKKNNANAYARVCNIENWPMSVVNNASDANIWNVDLDEVYYSSIE